MWLKKIQEHLRKTFVHAPTSARFFLFAGLILFSVLSKIQDEMTPPVVLPALAVMPTPQSEHAFSAMVSRVYETCTSLPKPERFEFISRTAPTETEQFVSIAYTYRSPRAASEIYPMIIVWFANNGWTDNKPVYERDKKAVYERLEFSKDNQTVRLTPPYSSGEDDFFMVSCIEWKGVSADD
jgi:hypothetical protein